MAYFNASYSGIGDMLTAPFMIAAMEAHIKKAEVVAVAIAPEHTGEYKSRFETEAGVRHAKTSRAYAVLRNTDPKALHLEFGTDDTPKFRTLGRAILAAV